MMELDGWNENGYAIQEYLFGFRMFRYRGVP